MLFGTRILIAPIVVIAIVYTRSVGVILKMPLGGSKRELIGWTTWCNDDMLRMFGGKPAVDTSSRGTDLTTVKPNSRIQGQNGKLRRMKRLLLVGVLAGTASLKTCG